MTTTEWRDGVEVEPQPARRVRPGWLLLIDGALWRVDAARPTVAAQGERRKAAMTVRAVVDNTKRTILDELDTTVYKVVAGGDG